MKELELPKIITLQLRTCSHGACTHCVPTLRLCAFARNLCEKKTTVPTLRLSVFARKKITRPTSALATTVSQLCVLAPLREKKQPSQPLRLHPLHLCVFARIKQPSQLCAFAPLREISARIKQPPKLCAFASLRE